MPDNGISNEHTATTMADIIQFIPETDSTNIEMHRRMESRQLPHGYCIIADYQTAGHGQQSNHWESEKGKNLLFSILLHPTAIKPAEQFVITEIVSLSIREVLQQEIPDEIEIKWPNDIYVNDQKLCGILIENSICGNSISDSICGIGININQETFTGNAPNPVSLKNISRRNHDRESIIRQIYTRILTLYETVANDITGNTRDTLHREYMSHLYHRQGTHTYCRADETDDFRARIQHIDHFGRLTLQLEDGTTETFAFKEISQIIGSSPFHPSKQPRR